MSLIAFFCVLFACLTLSCLTIWGNKNNSWIFSCSSIGISHICIIFLAVLGASFNANVSGFSAFIVMALTILLFSNILKSIPVRETPFKNLTLLLDLSSSICFAFSIFLLIPLNFISMPSGLLVGIGLCLIYSLIKKKLSYKEYLPRFSAVIFSFGALSQGAYLVITTFSIGALILAIASLAFTVFGIIDNLINTKESKINVVKKILYYLSIMLFASSIFMFIF